MKLNYSRQVNLQNKIWLAKKKIELLNNGEFAFEKLDWQTMKKIHCIQYIHVCQDINIEELERDITMDEHMYEPWIYRNLDNYRFYLDNYGFYIDNYGFYLDKYGS